MAEILEFPFDSGTSEAADKKWQDPRQLVTAENVRLSRDGRLTVRPGYTSLSLNTLSANTLTPYDLANYAGRLIALGTQTTGATRPTDLFEYVSSRSRWRATAGDNTTTRLPQFTDVREIGRTQDQAGLPRTVGLAYGAGYLCVAASMGDEVKTIVHVFDPTTDQTILLTTVDLEKCKVVFANSVFIIVGVDSADDVYEIQFNPATGTTLGSASLLTAFAADVKDLAVTTNGTNYAWAVARAAGVQGQIRTTSGLVAGFTPSIVDSNGVGLAMNSAGTRVSVVRRDTSANTYDIETVDSTGATVVGPTALLGGFVATASNRLACWQDGSNVRIVGMAEDTAVVEVVTQAAHANVAGPSAYRNTYPAAAGVMVGNNGFFGVQDEGSTSDGSGTFHVSSTNVEGSGSLVFLPQVFCYPRLQSFFSKIENVMNQMATDGSGKVWWPVVFVSENTGNDPIRYRYSIFEANALSSERRQMAEVGGEMHISGGLPLMYDGRVCCEQGFAERPAIVSITQATNGNLTPLGTYNLRAVWEVWDGKHLICRSQGSETSTVTMTGANDELQLLVTSPHSLRCHPLFSNARFTVRVAVYRTIASGANFFLDNFEIFDSAVDDFGETIQVNLTQTDTAIADNLTLYEQSQTPVPHVSPPPYRYVWAARERQLIGGCPDDDRWQYSKLAFPGECMQFSSTSRLGFSGRANQGINAVGAFENVGIFWTANEIGQIPGRGPEHVGTGEFDSWLTVPSPGGTTNWRSLVLIPEGMLFQMGSDKIMLLRRDQTGAAASVEWIGQPVRTTLAAFPNIVAACYVKNEMAVAFACNDAGNLNGRLLIYDLRRQIWYVDNLSGPFKSLSHLDGRLVAICGSSILLQDVTPGSGTFVPYQVETAMQPVTKRMGWGHIYRIGLGISALGACTIEAFIDYNMGAGFQSLGTETIAGTEGDKLLMWSLNQQKTASFALKFVVTSASSNSLGVQLNTWAVEVEGSKNMVRNGSTGIVA